LHFLSSSFSAHTHSASTYFRIVVQPRIPRQLPRNRSILLQPILIDRRLPCFVLHPRAQCDVLPKPLHHAARELVLRCPAGNEVERSFLVQIFELHPLIGGQMISRPSLAALRL